MLESKSSALPAWLRPIFLVHLGGFEPPAHGLEVRCSILLSYRCILNYGAGEGDRTLATGLEGQGSTTELHPHLERKTGFEPATLALARRCSTTEPLSHLVEGTGFEPVKAVLTDLQSVPFGQLGNPSKLWSW